MKLSHPIRVAFVLACLSLLAACGGGKPVRRINPPTLSIQQLAVQADGRWLLELRVQNFSTVPMRFDTLEAGLEIEGSNVGAVFLRPAIEIPGQSADIVEATRRRATMRRRAWPKPPATAASAISCAAPSKPASRPRNSR